MLSKKKLIIIILLFFFLLDVVTIFIIFLYPYYKGTKEYSELKEFYIQSVIEDKSDNYNKEKLPAINFSKLSSINSDIIGWISISDTAIDYPVCQTDNNSTYLEYTFKKSKNKVGCIFMDCNTSFDSDSNIVIYGHNMADGSMFGSLKKYESQEYFSNHTDISFTYYNGIHYKYNIISVAKIPVNLEKEYYVRQWDNTTDYHNYRNLLIDKSIYKCINQSDSNKFITLSTCTSDKNYKLVVIGQLENTN